MSKERVSADCEFRLNCVRSCKLACGLLSFLEGNENEQKRDANEESGSICEFSGRIAGAQRAEQSELIYLYKY